MTSLDVQCCGSLSAWMLFVLFNLLHVCPPVQERLTKQIAVAITEALQPIGVGVVIEATYVCSTVLIHTLLFTLLSSTLLTFIAFFSFSCFSFRLPPPHLLYLASHFMYHFVSFDSFSLSVVSFYFLLLF